MSIIFLLIIGAITYFLYNNHKRLLAASNTISRCRKLLRDIPGPPSVPLIGSVHLFKWNSEAFTLQLEEWGRKYLLEGMPDGCGILKVWIGPIPLVFCGTADSCRVILESTINIAKPVQYDILSTWIGTGLLTSTSEKWFQRRKMLTPAFHFNVLQGYHHVFNKNGRMLVEQLKKRAAFNEYFDIFPYIKRCALDIICETAMGTEMNAQLGHNNEYVEAVTRIQSIIWDYQRFPWFWFSPIWYGSGRGFEFDRLVKLTNNFTRDVIAKKKVLMEEESFELSALSEEQIKHKKLAFLDLLLNMQKATKELSDEDIREEVDTFMFEGHDTTSSGIGFSLWWLGQEPRCLKIVQEELYEIFGDSDREPTAEDVKQMVYLEKCVKEALRLMPSVPLIARRLEHDVKIGKHILPQGLSIVVVPLSAQRDPRHYERPEEFYPEHFDTDKTVKRDPYAYIPFSAGPRNCIGQKFAILEEKIVLSWVLRYYDIRTQTPWPGNRPVPEIILKPPHGFHVKLYPRTPLF